MPKRRHTKIEGPETTSKKRCEFKQSGEGGGNSSGGDNMGGKLQMTLGDACESMGREARGRGVNSSARVRKKMRQCPAGDWFPATVGSRVGGLPRARGSVVAATGSPDGRRRPRAINLGNIGDHYIRSMPVRLAGGGGG